MKSACYKSPMVIETFAVGPLGCNCSILVDDETELPSSSIRWRFREIRARLEENGAKVLGHRPHPHAHRSRGGHGATSAMVVGASPHPPGRQVLLQLLPLQANSWGCLTSRATWTATSSTTSS